MAQTHALRAVVIGAGWAGEGHTLALRHAGVEVAAICARQPEVVQAVADRLGVPEALTDWRETLRRVKPDIVALATPAALRGEVVEVASAAGSHVFCDKPLATTAAEAERLYRLVEQAGIKHVYLATLHYEPSIAWVAELVREGAIGTPREMAYSIGFPLFPLRPWNWGDRLETGGGILNNLAPHVLAMLEMMTGGEVVRAMGESRLFRLRGPVVPGIHDFRIRMNPASIPSPEQAEQLEWRDSDSDGGSSAVLAVESPTGVVIATMRVSTVAAWPLTGWYLVGDGGRLLVEGFNAFTVSRLHDGGEREVLPVPQRLLDALPNLGNGELNRWAMAAQDFVADIRGEPHQPYLTFRDGWRFQEVIDAIRSGRGWVEMPAEAAHG